MAGKNQLDRVRIMDSCFRRGVKYTWNQLQDKLEEYQIVVSKRTILQDISDMRNGTFGFPPAPIVTDQNYYHYSEKGFSIFAGPILDKETLILMNALDILNQFPEFKHNEKVKEIIEKIKKSIGFEERDMEEAVHFDKPVYPAATEWISTLYPYIKAKENITLIYKPFSAEEAYEKDVRPLLLKEFNGRWYLIGYNLEESCIHNYALDRLEDMKECYEYYNLKDFSFNPEEYFKYIIGVTNTGEEPITIIFKTSDFLKNYILTKPFHFSQKLIDEEKNIFQLTVQPNIELIAKFLSYGPDLEVLGPEDFLKDFKQRVERMNSLYY